MSHSLTGNARRSLVAIALAGLALVVAACGADDSQVEGGTDDEPITMAVGVDPVFTPLFLAEQEDLFEEEGLDVDIRQFANAGEAVDALVAGGVDVAGVPDYNFLIRADRGDIRAFGLFAEDPGTYVKVAAAEEVQDPSEFESMGIVDGTYSVYGAVKLLESAGVDPASVELIPAGPPELPALLERGQIDGFVLWEPWPTQATEHGGKVLMTTEDYGLSTVLSLAAKQEWLDANPEQAEALVRVLVEADSRVEDDPAAAAAVVEGAAEVPADLTEQAIGDLTFEVREFTPEDIAAFDEISDFLVDQGIVDDRPSADELFINEFVNEG